MKLRNRLTLISMPIIVVVYAVYGMFAYWTNIERHEQALVSQATSSARSLADSTHSIRQMVDAMLGVELESRNLIDLATAAFIDQHNYVADLYYYQAFLRAKKKAANVDAIYSFDHKVQLVGALQDEDTRTYHTSRLRLASQHQAVLPLLNRLKTEVGQSYAAQIFEANGKAYLAVAIAYSIANSSMSRRWDKNTFIQVYVVRLADVERYITREEHDIYFEWKPVLGAYSVDDLARRTQSLDVQIRKVNSGIQLSKRTDLFNLTVDIPAQHILQLTLPVLLVNATALIAFVLGLYLIIAFFLNRQVLTPLVSLRKSVRDALTTGELDIAPALLTRGDEINDLGQQFVALFDQVARLAHEDSVTGLLTRKRFVDSVDRYIREHENGIFDVFYIDLDNFKQVNDYYGHAEGDRLLCDFARQLEGIVASYAQAVPGYLITRLAGDEFAVFIEYPNRKDNTLALANGLLQLFEVENGWQSYNLSLSASIGVSTYPIDGVNAEELLSKADDAMYLAKQKGKNCCERYSEVLSVTLQERKDVELAIREELSEQNLFLAFQPIYDAAKNISGAEALLRSSHPLINSVGLERAIEIAESSVLICDIDLYVLERAIARLKQLSLVAPSLTLSVNVSTAELSRSRFPDQLRELLADYNVNPSNLELEITETRLVTTNAQATDVLNRLKELGVAIVLDDFGTGHTQLSHLYEFGVDKIKIDREFVAAIGEANDKSQLVDFLLGLSKTSGMGVVAEGVENASQFEYLKTMGCPYYQGYWFNKPMPWQSLLAIVRQ